MAWPAIRCELHLEPYVWASPLPNNWQGQTYTFTLRNMRLGYGPVAVRHSPLAQYQRHLRSSFRQRQAFCKSRRRRRQNYRWLDSSGSIFNFQTGTPFLLGGGSGNGDPFTASTFNNNPNADGLGDGGVVLHGVTVSQLQSSVGVYHIPGQLQASPSSIPSTWPLSQAEHGRWSEPSVHYSERDAGNDRDSVSGCTARTSGTTICRSQSTSRSEKVFALHSRRRC